MSNLQVASVLSESLGHSVRMRLTPRGIKTIEHNGGIDAYLLGTNDSKRSPRDEGAEAPRRVGQGQEGREEGGLSGLSEAQPLSDRTLLAMSESAEERTTTS